MEDTKTLLPRDSSVLTLKRVGTGNTILSFDATTVIIMIIIPKNFMKYGQWYL